MMMLTAALRAAEAGWRVLPCDPRPGPRCKRPIGRLVPHGLTNASTDPRAINRWWSAAPDALLGAVVPAGHVVIDIDPYHGGTADAVADAAGTPLPPTLTVMSGRGDGGAHLYYRVPAGTDGDTLSGRQLPAGVDLRKAGRNYCIMPPSIHPSSGKPYTWIWRPAVDAPAGLLRLLTPPPAAPWTGAPVTDKRVAAWVALVESAPVGRRNDTLFWVACRAAEAGVLAEHSDRLVHAAVGPDFPESEALKAIRSADHRVAR